MHNAKVFSSIKEGGSEPWNKWFKFRWHILPFNRVLNQPEFMVTEYCASPDSQSDLTKVSTSTD